MNQNVNAVPPIWYWIVSSLLLLWNLFGLAVFIMSVTMFSNREGLEKAGMNEEQIDLILSTPFWVTIAFGAAVIFGVLGCVALLMRRKLAITLLVISLIAVLAQNFFVYFMSNSIEIMGVGASPAVILGAIAIVPFAVVCARRGWLT